MNMSLTAVSSSVDDIEAGAAKLNTSAQRLGYSESLNYSEIFRFIGSRPTIKPPKRGCKIEEKKQILSFSRSYSSPFKIE